MAEQSPRSLHDLLLEIDQVQQASGLFTTPHDQPGFDYLLTVEDVRIYKLEPQDKN